MSKFNIKMVDLGSQYLRLKREIDLAIKDVLDSTAFINGPEVKEFAEELANYNRVSKAVTCGNGTDALQIAFMALGLKPGDEVVVPVFTYVATAEALALLGVKPIFVGVDPDTFNIDVNQIEAAITEKTRAIVPVHLFGQCADMEPLLDIAERNSLYVVEDTAQAIGAEYTFSNGKVMCAGTMGDFGTLSFFPSKNLGCFGDGGALLSNSEELAELAHIIANHGQRVKYSHSIIGCNSRLDTIQAAVLRVKLRYLNSFRDSRVESAEQYSRLLSGVDGVTTPKLSSQSTHVYHQYTVILSEDIDRVEVIRLLKEEYGVPSMVYYPIPLHRQEAFAEYRVEGISFKVEEDLSKHVLSLPIHTEQSSEEINYIADSLIKVIERVRG